MWNDRKKNIVRMSPYRNRGYLPDYGKFLADYHVSILCLSTRWFIIKNVLVEVDHDNSGHDKRVV